MSIVKYPGGKERELTILTQFFPQQIDTYLEPFVGGGSVYMNIKADKYKINDFSKDLINLYTCIRDQNHELIDVLEEIDTMWSGLDRYMLQDEQNGTSINSIYSSYKNGFINDDELKEEIHKYSRAHKSELMGLVDGLKIGFSESFLKEWERIVLSKMPRMKVLDQTKKKLPDEDIKANLLGCLKAAMYMYIRYLYNHAEHYSAGFKAALYLFIRDMCYSGMFRFNANGEFNVPYGGISYNNKGYQATIRKYTDPVLINKLNDTVIACQDYKDFLSENIPQPSDFMFVDPPYDSEFSTYDQNAFDANAQIALAEYLIKKCKCKFMVDIKYTEFIASLYQEGSICANGDRLRIVTFDKKYAVSFMNRNKRATEHMLIMNYET